jgi:hypothetical protein
MFKFLAFLIVYIFFGTAQAQTSEQVFIQKIKTATDAAEKKDFSTACFMFYMAL